MKICPMNRDCTAFETIDEVNKIFIGKGYTGKKNFNDIEISNSLTLSHIQEWADCFGV